MNSRERGRLTLSHNQPDKLVVDFGATLITGMHVSMVYMLRQYFGLDDTGTPVKVVEPFQMLGEIKDDLKKIIGVDFTALEGKRTLFGFAKENWKEWKLNDGTPVLVPGLFNIEKNKDGSIYQYAEGDKNYPPSAKMPKRGFFFDAIIRQKEIDDGNLNPKDNLEEYGLIDKEDLIYLKEQAENLYSNTDYSIVGGVCSSSFGDVGILPGFGLKDPKGIRDFEEWYISLYKRRDYIKKVFEGQCEIAIENYRRIYEEVGNLIDVFLVTAADFGMQQGLFDSLDSYRDLFKPFHKKINNWIHQNTDWKCFIHTCGSAYDLMLDFIDAGFDILNPVQISAKGMEPDKLKKEFGKDITFWGGGIDTQRTLPLKSPKEVKEEARRLIDIFSPSGGFVFNAVHNVQANVPVENMVAVIEAIQEYR